MISVQYVVALAVLLFMIGAIGVLVRKNPLIMFMSAK